VGIQYKQLGCKDSWKWTKRHGITWNQDMHRLTVLTRNDSTSVMFLCAECMVIIRYQLWKRLPHASCESCI